MKIFKQDKEVPRHAVWYHSPFWYWDLIRTGFAFELGGIADRSATNRQKTHAAAQKVTASDSEIGQSSEPVPPQCEEYGGAVEEDGSNVTMEYDVS